jgi:hypothetical protein
MMRSRRQKTILDAFKGSRFKIRIGEKITDSEFVKVLRKVMLKLEMRSINLSEQSNTLRDCGGQMLISVRDAVTEEEVQAVLEPGEDRGIRTKSKKGGKGWHSQR